MTVLPAQGIRALADPASDGRPAWTRDAAWLDRGGLLVSPYVERTRFRGKTFGVGPAGYDLTVAESFWLWPFYGRLASARQRLDLPADLTFIVFDKSSWARVFVSAMNTNGEPGWHGWLTLELVRFLPWPIYIRAGDPIVHVMFLRLQEPTDSPYEGKYQDQERGPQAARYDGGRRETGWQRLVRDVRDWLVDRREARHQRRRVRRALAFAKKIRRMR